MSTQKPCKVQILRSFGHSDSGWIDAGDFGSVKAARRGVVSAIYRHIDRLSSAWYEVRLMLHDGTVRALTEAQQEWAIGVVKYEQWDNSIGRRLERGEAVAV